MARQVYEFFTIIPPAPRNPVNYINDPRIMAMNDRVIAINNAIEVDLYGQPVPSPSALPRSPGPAASSISFRSLWLTRRKGLICPQFNAYEKDGTIVSRIRR